MYERVAFEREMRSLQVFERNAPTSPAPEQTGPKPCRGKSPKPVPDKPTLDITGRYYTAKPSQSVVINQAGRHFEAVISFPKRLNVSRDRGHTIRAGDKEPHRQMKVLQGDLVKGDEYRWFNRDNSADAGVIRQENGKLYLIPKDGPNASEKIELVAMEKRPTLMGTVPTLRRRNWDMNRVELNELQPLIPWQKKEIERLLDQHVLDKVFKAYFVDQIKNPSPIGVLINRFSERSTPQSPNYQPWTKFDQFPAADLVLVREYSRRVLTAQKWTNARNVTRSHIDWIQAMVDQEAGRSAGPDEVFTRQLGLRPSPRGSGGDHKYEFAISLIGGSLVLGGFAGSVTIQKLNGRKWTKTYDIDLMGLNVSSSGLDVKLGESWKGYAESYLEWTENDMYGGVRFFGAKAGAGMDLAKARAGFMHVLGDERLPPLEVLFWDAKLGVPNPDKVAEKMLKNVLQGEQKDKVTEQITKKGVPSAKDLLKPSIGAAVLFGDITPTGSLLEKMRKLKKPYEPVDLTRKLPGPEALGAEVQSSAHFCLNDDQPTPAGVQALRALCARHLAVFGAENASVKVLGHADTLGHEIPGHNQKLSQRRADNTVAAIKGILGSRYKVKSVEAKGLGDSLASIESKGKAQAAPQFRRVDIYVNGSLELSMF
jgi:outer membrane protein OmpA-like peptidoglycan-associated protein